MERSEAEEPERWNLHLQRAAVVGAFRFSSRLFRAEQPEASWRETVSFDLTVGARLWRGAAFYIDGLLWQGFGLSDAVGVAGFPNGEAFRLGTHSPNATVARAFLRQAIDLVGAEEWVEDDPFQLAGERAISRITITVGKMNVKDLFDKNAYANDPRTQFLKLGAHGEWSVGLSGRCLPRSTISMSQSVAHPAYNRARGPVSIFGARVHWEF